MNVIEPVITSRKNSHVTETAALHEKKYRYERGLFLIEGEKLVAEAISYGLPIVELFLSEGKAQDVLSRLKQGLEVPAYDKTDVYTLSEECFLKISSEKSPQGVIAVLKYLDIFKSSTIIRL